MTCAQLLSTESEFMIMHSRPFKVKKSMARALLLAALISLLFAGSPSSSRSMAQGQSPVDDEAFRIQAQAHHDLAIHFLKKGEVDKALVEARQILQGRPPVQYEERVARSMMMIAEELGSMHRYDIAQALLDEALGVMSQAASKIVLLKHKSRLYYLAGDTDKAIDAMKRAKDLESRRR